MKNLLFLLLISLSVFIISCGEDETKSGCNPECKGWEACTSNDVCVLVAGMCGADTDCTDGKKCDSETNKCVADTTPECTKATEATDCTEAGKPVCSDEGKCVADTTPECTKATEATDCTEAGKPVCDVNGVCVEKINSITINLEGYAQKGPFVNGSAVEISELDSSLNLTGNKFNTQIVSDDGRIELDNLTLESPIVELKVDGYYFNEVSGTQSTSQLTLYAIANVTDSSSVNANLLTTVEKRRVRYLLSEGKTLAQAKEQAQTEIFAAFNITLSTYTSSEHLSIDGTTDADGALLALNLILTGYRTNAELTQLLSRLSTDFKDDGIINNELLKSDLINQAKFLNLATIRSNIEDYYTSLMITMTAPNFEQYINSFIDNTDFVFTGSPITYDENPISGKNILNENVTVIKASNNMGDASIQAVLPAGGSLKVKITPNNPRTVLSIPGGSSVSQNISYERFDGGVDFTFTSDGEGWQKLIFLKLGTYKIDFYEMGDTITKTKIISVVNSLTVCDGVSCSGGTVCSVFSGVCVEPLCEAVECGEHGSCTVENNAAKCDCDTLYEDVNLFCRLIPTKGFAEECDPYGVTSACMDSLKCVSLDGLFYGARCYETCTEESATSNECNGGRCVNRWSDGFICEPVPAKTQELNQECDNLTKGCVDGLICDADMNTMGVLDPRCYKPCATEINSDPECKDAKACINMEGFNGSILVCEPVPSKTQELGDECDFINLGCKDDLLCVGGEIDNGTIEAYCYAICSQYSESSSECADNKACINSSTPDVLVCEPSPPKTQTEGQECNIANLGCVDGLHCDFMGDMTCIESTQELGEMCDENNNEYCKLALTCNPYTWVCAERTQNLDETCDEGNNLLCLENLVCYNQICATVTEVAVGETCNNVSLVCGINSICYNNTCTEITEVQVDESCNGVSLVCADGLICEHIDDIDNQYYWDDKYCYKPCSSVSASSVECDNNACIAVDGGAYHVCEPNPAPTQNLGDKCGIHASCTGDLICETYQLDDGSITYQEYCLQPCVAEASIDNDSCNGNACNLMNTRNEDILACEAILEQTQGLNEDCNQLWAACIDGLHCDGNEKVCVENTQDLDENCNEWSFCKLGLTCNPQTGTCAERTQNVDETCDEGNNSLCLENLVCYNNTCTTVTEVTIGETCNNVSLVCGTNSVCYNNTCTEITEVQVDESCNGVSLVCADGLICEHLNEIDGNDNFDDKYCYQPCSSESTSSTECDGNACIAIDGGAYYVCEPNPIPAQNLGDKCSVHALCTGDLTCEIYYAEFPYQHYCFQPCAAEADIDNDSCDGNACNLMNAEDGDVLVCEAIPEQTQGIGDECNELWSACVGGLVCTVTMEMIADNNPKECFETCTTEAYPSDECNNGAGNCIEDDNNINNYICEY